jgi:putative DNA primase/helicase
MNGKIVYKEPIDFRPRAGHWLSTNKLPPTKDTSGGFARRPVVLTWNFRIPDKDENGLPFKNLGMRRQLVEQEGPAIVSAALRALSRAIARNGYTIPASSEELVSEWVGTYDTMANYIRERLVVLDLATKGDPKVSWMEPDTLYVDYVEWGKAAGLRNPLTKFTFGRDLKRAIGVTAKQCHTTEGTRYPVRFRAEVEREEAGRQIQDAMDSYEVN